MDAIAANADQTNAAASTAYQSASELAGLAARVQTMLRQFTYRRADAGSGARRSPGPERWTQDPGDHGGGDGLGGEQPDQDQQLDGSGVDG